MGKSGLGKEFPVNLSKELVTRANVTRVIAGRSSIQAIIQELGTARTQKGQPPITDSRGFIVNGELSTAVIQDPDSLTVLTDLYDNKSSWTNLLKGDGPKELKQPYITALFGSSPAHFYDSIPQVNIEGGYIGRNLLVFEEKRVVKRFRSWVRIEFNSTDTVLRYGDAMHERDFIKGTCVCVDVCALM